MPDRADAYAPTLVGADDFSAASPAPDAGPSSSSREAVHVGFRPRFEDETASLLRRRLTAASVAIVAAFAITFCLSLTAAVPVPVPELRASLLAVTALCLILLRSPIPLSLGHVHLIEFATLRRRVPRFHEADASREHATLVAEPASPRCTRTFLGTAEKPTYDDPAPPPVAAPSNPPTRYVFTHFARPILRHRIPRRGIRTYVENPGAIHV